MPAINIGFKKPDIPPHRPISFLILNRIPTITIAPFFVMKLILYFVIDDSKPKYT